MCCRMYLYTASYPDVSLLKKQWDHTSHSSPVARINETPDEEAVPMYLYMSDSHRCLLSNNVNSFCNEFVCSTVCAVLFEKI